MRKTDSGGGMSEGPASYFRERPVGILVNAHGGFLLMSRGMEILANAQGGGDSC